MEEGDSATPCHGWRTGCPSLFRTEAKQCCAYLLEVKWTADSRVAELFIHCVCHLGCVHLGTEVGRERVKLVVRIQELEKTEI